VANTTDRPERLSASVLFGPDLEWGFIRVWLLKIGIAIALARHVRLLMGNMRNARRCLEDGDLEGAILRLEYADNQIGQLIPRDQMVDPALEQRLDSSVFDMKSNRHQDQDT
jgi:hypothetical protein